MTDTLTLDRPKIAEKDFVLATDLDGTFLGGEQSDRVALYDWIEDNRDTVGLIFVTGRDPEFIFDLCETQGVPRPEYVVGDVGTTIAEVTSDGQIAPIPELEEEIAEAWGDNTSVRVRMGLDPIMGLKLQPTKFRYRMSFDYDPEKFDPLAVEIVDQLGLDHLISAEQYFDVLPKGVSKGPSILRLLAHLGIEQGKTLVAGDTFNDLSMLQTGLPAVAVGGSEKGLLEAVKHIESVYQATAIGAAGIREAIREMNMHPAA